jgi:hypothetical protein
MTLNYENGWTCVYIGILYRNILILKYLGYLGLIIEFLSDLKVKKLVYDVSPSLRGV